MSINKQKSNCLCKKAKKLKFYVFTPFRFPINVLEYSWPKVDELFTIVGGNDDDFYLTDLAYRGVMSNKSVDKVSK